MKVIDIKRYFFLISFVCMTVFLMSCKGGTTTDSSEAADAAAAEAEAAAAYSFGSNSGSSFSEGQLEIKVSSIPSNGSTEISAYIVDKEKLLTSDEFTVDFKSNCSVQSLASFDSSSVTTTTGIATTIYKDLGCLLSDTVTATITINGSQKVAHGNITISPSTTSLSIGSGSGSSFSSGNLEIKVDSISVNGSTTISAYIVDENNLLSNESHTVSFTSNCFVQSKAMFSATNVTTTAGIATTTYTDNGCLSSDTITATVSLNGEQKAANGNITIAPKRFGSGSGTSFTEGGLEIKVSSILTGGSTTVSAYIVDTNGVLSNENHTVNFSSNCSVESLASFEQSSVSTTTGIASTTYIDKGCLSSDTINATTTLNNALKTASGTITITIPNVEDPVITANSLTLLSNSASLSTGNSNYVELTAIAKDTNNNLLEGVDISFTSDGGAIEVTQGTTDTAGTAKAKLSTSGDPQNRRVTVRATSGSVTDIIYVDIVGTTISISGPTSSTYGNTESYQLFLSDANGTGISFETISVSTKNTIINAGSGFITDANGNFTLELKLNQSETLTVQAFSGESIVRADQAISVSTDSLSLNITTLGGGAISNNEMDIGVNYKVNFEWKSSEQPVIGQQVDFFATRGVISDSPATTDANGKTFVQINSNNSGPTSITAKTSSGPTTSANYEFVATTPNSLVLQAEKSTLGPNVESSTLSVIVRDLTNNLVKNKTIRFSLVEDSTGGTITNSTAITDSLGKASTSYQSSNSTSAKDGITIRAYVDGQTITDSADCASKALCDEVSLTVAQQELFVKLGTANNLTTVGSTLYSVPYSVLVTDAAGNAVAGKDITITLVPIRYYNGCRLWNGSSWGRTSNTPTFPKDSEDVNKNGILDAGEDGNNNGTLEPGNVASAPSTVTTGDDGYVEFNITYAKSYASYVDFELTASSSVAGTESIDTIRDTLSVLAGDVNDADISPPGPVSKWEEVSRTNGNGTAACDGYFN